MGINSTGKASDLTIPKELSSVFLGDSPKPIEYFQMPNWDQTGNEKLFF